MHQALDDGLATMKTVVGREIKAELGPVNDSIERLKQELGNRG